MPAHVCLFTYNRLNETKQTIEALQENCQTHNSDLFIFSDGPKIEHGKFEVGAVREYIQTITGFESLEMIKSNENKGWHFPSFRESLKCWRNTKRSIILEDD